MIAGARTPPSIYPSGPALKESAHAFAARAMGQARMTEDIPSPGFASMHLMYPNDYVE